MKNILVYVLVMSALHTYGQSSIPEIKNVILLIPDGASMDLITLARWYNNNNPLALDSIICGMIQTHSVDNRFPDSAPTSTAYATGIKTVSGYVGVDREGAPHVSVMELARLQGMATGIVATCEFPHATPADFVCHLPNRKNYNTLTTQFLNNSPDLVFAGGREVLENANNGQSLIDFKEAGYRLITDKISFSKLKIHKDSIVWALFADWKNDTEYKSYQCDITRPEKEPSLSEMTAKAIELLSQNKKGFLLVVEGSQIDWACHNNDPFAAVTEFLEFDKAVGIALDFASGNGSTAVIVCPDHGNGGLSIGNAQSHTSFIQKSPYQYDKIDIREQVISPLKKIRCSARKLAELMLIDSLYIHIDTLKHYYSISDPEITINIRHLVKTFPAEVLSDTLQYLLGGSYSANNYIGWTTTGHTAEDVFLGIHVPDGNKRISGIIDNTRIAGYISELLHLGSLPEKEQRHFVRADMLFRNNPEIALTATSESLIVRKGTLQLEILPNTRQMIMTSANLFTGKYVLPTMAVCIQDPDGNPIYYLPESILQYVAD
ncbi:MAG: alkaline phosphatase [Bacteroidales bacterium]